MTELRGRSQSIMELPATFVEYHLFHVTVDLNLARIVNKLL
jgi:hypothetical protein